LGEGVRRRHRARLVVLGRDGRNAAAVTSSPSCR
jgi:hypothetical protein